MQEQRANGTRRTWSYDPASPWTPLAAIEQAGEGPQADIYWLNSDLNGAPLEVTDAEGNLRWSGQYDTFGKLLGQTVAGSAQRTGPVYDQPLRYAGQYQDNESGLHYNLFRYYEPEVGRFTTQDPVGLAGGMNLYAYAPNPLSWIDPLGLAKCSADASNGKYSSRNTALRAAKRDAGIPMTQAPTKVEMVNLTDRNGKHILGEDHLPLKTREYTFTRPNKESVVIQDHWPGHIYGPQGTPGNQGPHINIRPISDTRNGKVVGTLEHYPF